MKALFIFILLTVNVCAQPVLTISSGFDNVIPGKYCAYIVSPKGAYSFRQLLSDTTIRYAHLEHNLLFFNEEDYLEDIWIKLSVTNTSGHFQSAILELNNPLIDDVQYFDVVRGNLVNSNISGDEHPFATRSILFRNPIYTLSLHPGDTHTVYMMVNADGRKIHLPLTIKSLPEFIQNTSAKDIQFGLYYGALLVLTLISFYLAYTLSDRVFMYFALYIFCLLLSQLCTSGIAFAYLWPDMPYWNNRSITVTMSMTLIAGILFARSFVASGHINRWANLLMYAGIGAGIFCALTALGNTSFLTISMWILYRLIPLIYALLIVIGGYVLLKKFKSARLFVPGFIFAAIGIGGMSLYSVNKTVDNVFTNDIVIYAVLLKCIMLSVAMFDRLKIFKEEKETAQALVIEQLEELNRYKEEVNTKLEDTIQKKSKELIEKQNEVKRALISGEEKERKRVAQELHDGMGSLLSTLRLNAEAIDLTGKHLDEREAIAYQNVLEMIDKACTELRTISHNMLPSGIEHFGLVATLQALIKKINHNNNIQFSLETVGLESLHNQEIELHLYRIVMELINNAMKHSKAKQATIQLVINDNDVTIMVEDDGIGFTVRQDGTNGVGLLSVQSRVEALNGKFQIDSRINHGTTTTIEIPLTV
ncbi:MAG: 7TM diverse intracellular signaling domain-containing protein [Bacteroidota bacterium]